MTGISAVPDESNARYFHVVVAGPEGVRNLLIAKFGNDTVFFVGFLVSIRRWRVQTGAVPARRISYVSAKGPFHDQNLSSEY